MFAGPFKYVYLQDPQRQVTLCIMENPAAIEKRVYKSGIEDVSRRVTTSMESVDVALEELFGYQIQL